MSFLVPLMMLGALGAAIPIAIHLIGRRRAVVVRFAAIDFLLGSDRKVARRLRVREAILLAARVLLCLAIPLVLAKPYAACSSSGPLVERGPQAVVLVIDNSLASRYRVEGRTLLERGVEQARDILGRLGPEAEVAVTTTTDINASQLQLTRDHLRLRDSIRDLSPSAESGDTTGALERAARLLAGSNHESRVVYLLSPMAKVGFSDRAPWPVVNAPALRLVDLADGAALDNLAVTDLEIEPDPDSGSRGLRVTAEIANFSDNPLTDHGVSVIVDGQTVARGLIDIEARTAKKKAFTISLPGSARTAELTVRLDGDKLPIDNQRYAVAELRDEVPVLLVNGDPRTIRHDDELFYLSVALRPGDRGDSGAVLTTVYPGQLDDTVLAEFDVIVLANVSALPAKQAAQLASWVEGGGGLLVSMGDNVEPGAYNETMTALLPQRLNTAIDVVYGKRGSEREGRALRLTKLESEHPIFSVFSREASGLRSAGFWKVMLLGPTTSVTDRRVLARYSSGAAALVEARHGEGRLILLTSTVDRDWNDLPIHPGYLPLAQQTVRYLARKQQRPDRHLFVGRSAEVAVGPRDTRLEIESPSGRRQVFEGDNLEGRAKIRARQTEEPGFYHIIATTPDAEEPLSRREATFAVNLRADASDLSRMDPDAITGSAGGPAARIATGKHERRVELWHGIAVGLLALLLFESLLVLRTRRR